MNENDVRIRDSHVKIAFDLYIKQRKKNYRILRKMPSNGAFSSVYEVVDDKGKEMVMKAVDTEILDVKISPYEVIKYTNNEIKSMMSCQKCSYIMDLIDAADVEIDPALDEHIFLIFMPKMQVATKFFANNGYQLDSILSMAKDICYALDYCHSKKILHRDIKPENIYYSEEKGHFVLSDFGISRTMFDHARAVTRIGSLLAPEIMAFQNLNGRMNSDIYSLGITVLLLYSKMSNSVNVIADRFNSLNSDVKDVLMRAIDGNPITRYQTANEFLKAIEGLNVKKSVDKTHALSIEGCVNAFLDNNYRLAKEIAETGHKEGIDKMTCLYAYILSCEKKISDAHAVLQPLVRKEDAVAMGLYGIIGRLETTANGNTAKDREMVDLILKSAKKNFSVAQYYIGRWMIDGQSGFSVDIETGLNYIFESSKRGFLPSMHYLRKTLTRQSDKFVSVDSMIELMDIVLEGFSKENYPEELIRAIACA